MLAELIQLLIPVAILLLTYIVVINSFTHYDRFLEDMLPVACFASLAYLIVVGYATADKYGLIQKPVKYECPAGKVVFYNLGNVICIDGEKAKEIPQ